MLKKHNNIDFKDIANTYIPTDNRSEENQLTIKITDEKILEIVGEDSCYNQAGISIFSDGRMVVWGQGGESALFSKEQTIKILNSMIEFIGEIHDQK